MAERNICLTNDSFPPVIDGVANAVTNYARVIEKDYGSATVVTPYYPDADDSVFPFEVVRYPSIDLTKLVGYRAGNPLSAEVVQRLEEKHFDLIHTHCPVASTVLARILRDRIHVPLVFTYHTKFDIDIAHAIRGKKATGGRDPRALVENISACDEVWTVSRGAGENLRSLGYEGRLYRHAQRRGLCRQAGRAGKRPMPSARVSTCRRGVPVFLFVGRIMWYKGLRIILDAMKALKDSGCDFRMVFLSARAPTAPRSKPTVTSFCWTTRSFFVAPAYDRDVIRAWYCRADLFLFPSTFDTNGLVVREAAACGLASVLIAGSCAAEDITDGRNGFFIEENAASMAALLKKIYQDRTLLRQVGENAQKEIYISWDDAIHRACKRYDVVIDRFRSGAYPPHDAPSDEFYRRIAEYMAAVNRARGNLQELREGLQGGYEKLSEKLDTLWQKTDRFL